MDFKKEYLEIAEFAVERAAKAAAGGNGAGPAAQAEAYIDDAESLTISVSGRAVEQFNAVKEAGIGVRVLRGGKMAFGSSNDLSKKAVGELVDGLVKKAAFHSADEFNVIPGAEDGAVMMGGAGGDFDAYDPKIAEVPVQEKIKKALRLEAAGLEASPKITGSLMTIYQDGSYHKYLANSGGMSGWFRQSVCAGVAYLTAADGEARESGQAERGCVKWADLDPEVVGREAAEKAVGMLGAKPIGSAEMPMVIAPDVAVQIWSYIAGMLSADAVQKGRSMFAGKIGSRVAAGGFTLVDDGRLKGGINSAPFDGEGVATRTTPLISDGRLETFLYDAYTARRGRTRSTGNRSRDGYKSAGGIGVTNLYLKPGDAAPEAIIGGVGRGFYLTTVLGLFAGINSASGDFSIPSAGFMIEKGKIGAPVRGVTIGGNLFELLKGVEAVGRDLTWFNNTASPTVAVNSVKISGSGK